MPVLALETLAGRQLVTRPFYKNFPLDGAPRGSPIGLREGGRTHQEGSGPGDVAGAHMQ